MKETALITDITGQDGAHLAELFSTKATSYDDVHGIKRRSSLFNTNRIDHRYQDPHVDDQRLVLHYGDLKDPPTWSASFSRCSPTTSTTWQRRAIWRSASTAVVTKVTGDKRRLKVDPRYYRRTEVETLLGDPSKAKQKLGSEPKTTLAELVAEMVNSDYAAAHSDSLLKKAGGLPSSRLQRVSAEQS